MPLLSIYGVHVEKKGRVGQLSLVYDQRREEYFLLLTRAYPEHELPIVNGKQVPRNINVNMGKELWSELKVKAWLGEVMQVMGWVGAILV